MALTWQEKQAVELQEAAAQRKIAKQHEAAAADDAAWDALTKNFWPAESVAAILDADQRLAAGTLSEADHAALVTSINARTRGADATPEGVKAAFDAKLAVAKQTNATAVDSLNDEQFNALWDSIK